MAELDEGNVLNAGKEAASLDGLEDKPKAEEIVSSLLDDLLGALELDEIRLEAKPHDPKLLDIKDKVQADTTLKVLPLAELDEGNVLNAGKEAASLDGLEDKPKAEDIVSSLLDDLIGALELDEIRLEAKIELQEPKLLDIEDKADTTLKVPRDPPSPPCVNCF